MLTSGVPEILQVVSRKYFLNLSQKFAKLFQARFLIGLPGDNLKFEKYEIITKILLIELSLTEPPKKMKK